MKIENPIEKYYNPKTKLGEDLKKIMSEIWLKYYKPRLLLDEKIALYVRKRNR